MAETQVQALTPRHVAIIDFLIANPTMKKSEVAAHFGVTPAWLSVVIHSDAFQAQLSQRQGEAFHLMVAPLAEKLNALAHATVDRMVELAPVSDISVLMELGKFSVDRINYEGKPMSQSPGLGVQVHVHPASAQLLEQTRDRIARKGLTYDGEFTEARHRPRHEPTLAGAPSSDRPTTKELPAGAGD